MALAAAEALAAGGLPQEWDLFIPHPFLFSFCVCVCVVGEGVSYHYGNFRVAPGLFRVWMRACSRGQPNQGLSSFLYSNSQHRVHHAWTSSSMPSTAGQKGKGIDDSAASRSWHVSQLVPKLNFGGVLIPIYTHIYISRRNDPSCELWSRIVAFIHKKDRFACNSNRKRREGGFRMSALSTRTHTCELFGINSPPNG